MTYLADDSTGSPGAIGAVPEDYGAAALFWLQYGLQVMPLVPTQKVPALPWDPWLDGLSAAKVDVYWHRHPNHEVGFIVSDNLIVFDADTPAAVAALRAIEVRLGLTPSLVIKTTRGEHHYFRRAQGTIAKQESHSTEQYPDRLDIKTGRSMVVLPPSKGKSVLTGATISAGDLVEANQAFINAVSEHNGRKALPQQEHQRQRPDSPQDGPPRSYTIVGDLTGKMRLLRALLDHLDPDMGYEDWLKVLAVVFNTTRGSDDGFELVDAWSSRGGKYEGAGTIRSKWNSFSLDCENPVTVGTLIYMVKATGQVWPCTCHSLNDDFTHCDFTVIDPHNKTKDSGNPSAT